MISKHLIIFLAMMMAGTIFAESYVYKKWEFSTSGKLSKPAINKDGTIYVGSGDSKLYAINYDGSKKWSYKTNGAVRSTPAISNDGIIYFGSDDKHLRAINPDGSLKWRFEPDGNIHQTSGQVQTTPVIGSDGTIYFGAPYSEDGRGMFYAINKNGKIKWSLEVYALPTSATLGSDGTLYFGIAERASSGRLYAIDPNAKTKDKRIKWSKYTNGRITRPIISNNQTLYYGSYSERHSDENCVYAINLDGRHKWKFQSSTLKDFQSHPMAGNNNIYISSYDNKLYSINPDGTENWIFDTNTKKSQYTFEKSVPAISNDGTIYFGSEDHYLYAVNQDGSMKWKYKNDGCSPIQPTTAGNGTIYFIACSTLYALKDAVKETPKITMQPDDLIASIGDTVKFSVVAIGDKPFVYKWFKNGILINDANNKSVEIPRVEEDDYTTYSVEISNNYGQVTSRLAKLKPKQLVEKINFITDSDGTEENDFFYPAMGNGQFYVSQNGIHAGDWYGSLDAYDLNGELVWKKEFSSFLMTSPILDRNGNIYISDNDYLYSINKRGEINWKYSVPFAKNIAVGKDFIIYTEGKYICFINTDGTKNNRLFKAGHWLESAPAIGSDGTIYIGSVDKNLYAINLDGSKKWAFKTGGWLYATPAIGSDGTIYLGSDDKNLYALNPDGSKKWAFKTNDMVRSSPTVGSDGTIYVGSGRRGIGSDKNLYAINPDGSKKWERKVNNIVKPTLINSLDIIAVGNSLFTMSNGELVETFKFNPPTITWFAESMDDWGNWEYFWNSLQLEEDTSRSIFDKDNARILFLDAAYRLHSRSSELLKIENPKELKLKIMIDNLSNAVITVINIEQGFQWVLESSKNLDEWTTLTQEVNKDTFIDSRYAAETLLGKYNSKHGGFGIRTWSVENGFYLKSFDETKGEYEILSPEEFAKRYGLDYPNKQYYRARLVE